MMQDKSAIPIDFVGPALFPSEDANLIRLCDQLVAARRKYMTLYAGPGSPDDPDSDPIVGPQLAALDATFHELSGQLSGMTPMTLAGAQAMSRAAVAHIHRCADGGLETLDIAETLSMLVVDYLAQRAPDYPDLEVRPAFKRIADAWNNAWADAPRQEA